MLAPLCGSGPSRAIARASYATNFDLTENPISEGGKWRQLQTSHKTSIASSGGIAFGTQAINTERDPAPWNDSYAFINPAYKAFGPNQRVTITAHKDPGIDTDSTHEIELLLRFDDAAGPSGLVRGYECIISTNPSNQYCEIVSWSTTTDDDNSSANFVYLAGPGGNGTSVTTGDKFKAEISGDVISVYKKAGGVGSWVLLVSATDTRSGGHALWSAGQPGIGAYRGHAGNGYLGDNGFVDFLAEAL